MTPSWNRAPAFDNGDAYPVPLCTTAQEPPFVGDPSAWPVVARLHWVGAGVYWVHLPTRQVGEGFAERVIAEGVWFSSFEMPHELLAPLNEFVEGALVQSRNPAIPDYIHIPPDFVRAIVVEDGDDYRREFVVSSAVQI